MFFITYWLTKLKSYMNSLFSDVSIWSGFLNLALLTFETGWLLGKEAVLWVIGCFEESQTLHTNHR